jgi:hypothetical protein
MYVAAVFDKRITFSFLRNHLGKVWIRSLFHGLMAAHAGFW